MNLLRFSTEKQIHWEHRTARILLREFEARDEDAIVALFSEVSAQQFILRNQRNPEMTRKFAKAAAFHAGNPERVGYHFIVENLHTEEVMGMCGITRAWRNSKMSEIGWHLGERFSGQGFATEAAEAVINFAFEDRGVLRVQGDCFYNNFAVRRIFEKLGMTRPRFSTIPNWLLSIKYRECKRIVRYAIKRDEKTPNYVFKPTAEQSLGTDRGTACRGGLTRR